jgi:NADPH:quinone reductase-like Zn-dependent oxidoreductase
VFAHLKAGRGALAEYVAVETNCIARKPDEISFAEAAGLAVSGSTALTLIEAARLSPGQKVLLSGPCGGIGHFASQLVRQAVQSDGLVVGICSPSKMNLAKHLGCDKAFDYHSSPEEDGHSLVSNLASRFGGDADDEKFDIVIDSHGSQDLWNACPSFLKPGSDHPYVTVGPALESYTVGGMLAVIWKMLGNSLTPSWAGGVNRVYNQISSIATVDKLERLRELAEEKKLVTHVGGVWEMEDALEVS